MDQCHLELFFNLKFNIKKINTTKISNGLHLFKVIGNPSISLQKIALSHI